MEKYKYSNGNPNGNFSFLITTVYMQISEQETKKVMAISVLLHCLMKLKEKNYIGRGPYLIQIEPLRLLHLSHIQKSPLFKVGLKIFHATLPKNK